MCNSKQDWVYLGSRHPDACVVRVLYADGSESLLDPRHDLRNHSPDGFNWGYGGSGPAQLALALLAHWCERAGVPGPDDLALSAYQSLKRHLVACLPDAWEVSARCLGTFVDTVLAEADGKEVDWTLWRAACAEKGWLKGLTGSVTIRGSR